MAISISTSREKLAEVKATLLANQKTQPLFNTARFTRHMKKGYEMIMDRYWSGHPLAHVHVPVLTE